jgi:hypothetical protein
MGQPSRLGALLGESCDQSFWEKSRTETPMQVCMRCAIETENKLVGDLAEKFGLPDTLNAPSESAAAQQYAQNFSSLLGRLNDDESWQFGLTVNGKPFYVEASARTVELVDCSGPVN